MDPIRFFDLSTFLEPKCPKCQKILHFGVNTKYNDKVKTHICVGCNTPLKELAQF